jgi:ribosomal protein L14
MNSALSFYNKKIVLRIEDAKEPERNDADNHIWLRDGIFTICDHMGSHEIPLHQIVYFTKDEPHLVVASCKSHSIEKVREKITLDKVMKVLKDEITYIRISRSYIVHVGAILYRNNKNVYLVDGTEIRFSDNMADFCKKFYPTKKEWKKGGKSVFQLLCPYDNKNQGAHE